MYAKQYDFLYKLQQCKCSPQNIDIFTILSSAYHAIFDPL